MTVRWIGRVMVAVAIVVFIVVFFELTVGGAPSSCEGTGCLHGSSAWVPAMPLSILTGAGGIVLLGVVAPPIDHPKRRWSRTLRNNYSFIAIFEIGLATMFFIAAVFGPKEARGGMIFTGVLLGAVGGIIGYVGVRANVKDRLHDQGSKALATIHGITQTGMWVNNNPVVWLDLEVFPEDGSEPYRVRHREVIPQVLLGLLTSGRSLPVSFNPNNPKKLVVDWDKA